MAHLTNEEKLAKARIKLQLAQAKQLTEIVNSIPSFARDADEDQWQALGEMKQIYSETDITEMQETAQKLYYTNPSASGIIDTMVNFVVGKDATITPKDKREKVKKFWQEFCDKNGFDMRMKELVRRSFRDGESFTRLFRPKSGEIAPYVRFVEPGEITDRDKQHSYGIETELEDVETVISYRRTYHVGDYNREERYETIPAAEVRHTKIRVDSNVKRGVSFLVGIAKYIVKYGGWLDDRIMLNKIRTMFNVIMKVTGIGVDDAEDKFTDVSGDTSPNPAKMMPKSGSVLISNPGVEYEMMNLEINATDTKDDGRNIELMLSKGTGLTEYVTRGDASNSNYSSTMVSESPMVRMFESWQDFFEKEFQALYRMVIQVGIDMEELPENTDLGCTVNFAGLVFRDLKATTEALQIQRANKWVSNRTASEKLGYSYEDEKKRIEEEDAEESTAEEGKRNKPLTEEEDAAAKATADAANKQVKDGGTA